jgi:hypothetical protein
MRDRTPRGWHRWRVTVVNSGPVFFDPAARLSAALPNGIGAPPAGPGTAESGAGERAAADERGPDGIRHELVARVRQQIAAGTYDTEEKWLRAEEALLRRIDGRA